MLTNKKFSFIIIISIVLLALIGFYAAPAFRQLTLKLLGDMPVGVSSEESLFRLNLLLAFTLAFYPILTALVNFVFQAKGKYLYVIPTAMFATMFFFYGIRLYNIHEMIQEQTERLGVQVIMTVPFEQLQVENFVFIGAMIGGIVGAVFMKRLQKKGKI